MSFRSRDTPTQVNGLRNTAPSPHSGGARRTSSHVRRLSMRDGSALPTKGNTMKLPRAPKGRALALVAALALVTSACSGGGAPKEEESGGGGGGGNSGYTFAMITHETPGDTFWDRIKAGANQAATDTGSTLKYSADPDATKQAVLIQNAIDSKVDGIATTLVTPDALIPNVKKAVAAGIPVDTFNSGLGFYKQAGALTHFSSDEFLAGQQAGEKVKAAGGKKALCVIQQAGSVALEDRCKGVKDTFANTENIQVNGADDGAVTSAIQAKLSQDKAIDWVITLGAAQALDTIKAIPAAGSKAKVGTFDLNVDAAQAVQEGKLQFCIDQQPYLQGYLSITQLYLYKQNGNIMGGGGPVLTGPSFVDKSNVDAVLPFIKKNTR
jgi:simple sugar transport system substrate-binding protein